MNLIKGKYSLAEVVDYFRAEFRYSIYYKYQKLSFLLRDHIKEQIDFRIDVMMDRECYEQGQCKICGCTTPDLQFTNASCKGNCYPPIMNKTQWKFFKEYAGHYSDEATRTQWYNMNYEVTKIKQCHKALILKRNY